MFLSSTPIYFQVSILLHDRIYDRNISLFIPSRIHFVLLRRGLRFDANQRSCPTAARRARRAKEEKKRKEKKRKERRKREIVATKWWTSRLVSIYVHLKYDGHEGRFFFILYKKEEKRENKIHSMENNRRQAKFTLFPGFTCAESQ